MCESTNVRQVLDKIPEKVSTANYSDCRGRCGRQQHKAGRQDCIREGAFEETATAHLGWCVRWRRRHAYRRGAC